MKSMIIGTAGHIDHGKTALVQALTGVDTDRLAEEKRRGITIELGFAHLELDGPQGPVKLGFVDVPGHERFVHNMLAGVGGIDMVLFVVSAQESVKPQTREHFDICRLLQVPRGITVLTKCDLADPEMRQVVRMEVEELTQGSFLDASVSPIIEVSARTGEGLERLKQEMLRMAGEIRQKDSRAAFRLPIDRVFTIKGFGTVVTGTLIAGKVRKEQDVEVLPLGKSVRVRGVQVHGQSVDAAHAGQRTALNLVGVPQEELERGMMLTQQGLLHPAARVDVRLSLLPGAVDLRNRSPVHLHAFTSERIAQVHLYEGDVLRAGESGWAQLRMTSPLPCAPGDRFIIRQFSPVVTIGGGEIVDINPLRRLKNTARIAMLGELGQSDDQRRLRVLVSRRDIYGLKDGEAIKETGWTEEHLQKVIQAQTKAKEILPIDDTLVTQAAFNRATRQIFNAVKAFQKAHPLEGGIGRQALLNVSDLGRHVFSAALGSLRQAKLVDMTGDQVHLPGHRVVMLEDEADSKAQLEEAFATAGIKVPYLKDVLAGLRVDKIRAQKIVTLLLREKVLIKVSDELVFHRSTLDLLRQQVQDMKAQSEHMDVARFKDTFGLTRKYAIPLLEYLDRERITKRVGDERIIQ